MLKSRPQGQYCQAAGSSKPFGTEIATGPGPFGLAVSEKGIAATANVGYERFGITIIDPPGQKTWRAHHIWARTPHSTAPEIADPDWKGVTSGIAFDSEKTIWVSEGDSGRVRQVDIATGDRRKIVNINGPEWHASYTADLGYDSVHRLLYVVDPSNSRVVLIDARAGRVISSVAVGQSPFGIALSPDASVAYVTDSGRLSPSSVFVTQSNQRSIDRIRVPSPQAVLAAADRVFISNGRPRFHHGHFGWQPQGSR